MESSRFNSSYPSGSTSTEIERVTSPENAGMLEFPDSDCDLSSRNKPKQEFRSSFVDDSCQTQATSVILPMKTASNSSQRKRPTERQSGRQQKHVLVRVQPVAGSSVESATGSEIPANTASQTHQQPVFSGDNLLQNRTSVTEPVDSLLTVLPQKKRSSCVASRWSQEQEPLLEDVDEPTANESERSSQSLTDVNVDPQYSPIVSSRRSHQSVHHTLPHKSVSLTYSNSQRLQNRPLSLSQSSKQSAPQLLKYRNRSPVHNLQRKATTVSITPSTQSSDTVDLNSLSLACMRANGTVGQFGTLLKSPESSENASTVSGSRKVSAVVQVPFACTGSSGAIELRTMMASHKPSSSVDSTTHLINMEAGAHTDARRLSQSAALNRKKSAMQLNQPVTDSNSIRIELEPCGSAVSLPPNLNNQDNASISLPKCPERPMEVVSQYYLNSSPTTSRRKLTAGSPVPPTYNSIQTDGPTHENGTDDLNRGSRSISITKQTHRSRESSMTSNGGKKPTDTRLVRRQALHAARRLLADWALFFAVIGICLMIIENELTAADVYSKKSSVSHVVKSITMLSTIVLLLLIAQYHHVEVKLFMNANSAEDWRIAMTTKRWCQIILELSVCAICPIPGDFYFEWTTVHADGETQTSTEVPIDVLLSIPMFFRLYLICRVMLLHSRLFTDASSRSIGALNRVNFNARFVLKTLMTLCPGTVLLVVVATFWVIASWILRLCERYHTGDPVNIDALKHQNYLNSLWLIAITFLSIGYGDMVPNTYCGRAVAVISGVMGVSTSSMVVAVIARKLELTRAEKHVHNFMMDTQLTKRLKHAAANVLRETWMIYKHRRLVEKIDISKIRLHQRKFLMAIYDLRKVKRDQRKLAENSLTIGDIAKSSTSTYELVSDMTEWQEGVTDRLTNLDTQVDSIQTELQRLSGLLERHFHLSPDTSRGTPAVRQRRPPAPGEVG